MGSIAEQLLHHGQVVAERLAGSRRGDDDDIFLVTYRVQRVGLVLVELGNPASLEQLHEFVAEWRFRLRASGRASGHGLHMLYLPAIATPRRNLTQKRLNIHPVIMPRTRPRRKHNIGFC